MTELACQTIDGAPQLRGYYARHLLDQTCCVLIRQLLLGIEIGAIQSKPVYKQLDLKKNRHQKQKKARTFMVL